MIGGCFLAGVPLGLLIGRQDCANLGVLLSPVGLAALHDLTSLFHVGTSGCRVTLLTRGARCIHVRLGLCPERRVLRLVLLTDRLDLRLLCFGQIEITTKTFTTTGPTRAHLAATVIRAAIGTSRGGRC